PYYFANVSAVDHFIGKVLDHLDELGLTENTIIVFSSDHGEMLGSHGKRGKNIPEIEAFNIPFIIKWGDRFRHRVEDLILSVPDVMPTLLGLAGIEDKIPVEVQGKNYAGILQSHCTDPLGKPGSALFINMNSRGVYTGDQMFIVRENEGELAEAYVYDNITDPYQQNKVPFEEVENGQELRAELFRFLRETNDRWYQEKICSDFLSY
ncbi:MAG: sulfatase-like hydrolase/transferase, partial [Bacteroidales bacterium]|nr:sulfatase-like hydrolase/transferase [Bacteroidales bacterium]